MTTPHSCQSLHLHCSLHSTSTTWSSSPSSSSALWHHLQLQLQLGQRLSPVPPVPRNAIERQLKVDAILWLKWIDEVCNRSAESAEASVGGGGTAVGGGWTVCRSRSKLTRKPIPATRLCDQGGAEEEEQPRREQQQPCHVPLVLRSPRCLNASMRCGYALCLMPIVAARDVAAACLGAAAAAAVGAAAVGAALGVAIEMLNKCWGQSDEPARAAGGVAA